MPRPKAKVLSSLQSKGFRLSHEHHIFLTYHTPEGEQTSVKTKVSHSPKMKDIPDNLLSQMAKQCKLKRDELLGVIDCPIQRDALEALLAPRRKPGV